MADRPDPTPWWEWLLVILVGISTAILIVGGIGYTIYLIVTAVC